MVVQICIFNLNAIIQTCARRNLCAASRPPGRSRLGRSGDCIDERPRKMILPGNGPDACRWPRRFSSLHGVISVLSDRRMMLH
jgi:hypothetical protein